MHFQNLRNSVSAYIVGLGLLLCSGWAHADPPLRVARLGYADGQVSFSPAGEPDWVQATVNRPLTTGDRLWVDARSRAELQIGGSAIRLGDNTSVTLLNVDDHITQVQLTQGTLKLHVRHIDANQILEVDTPNLALTLHRAGDYRLDVSPTGDATEVSVQSGEAEVYGDGASYAVHAGQGYRFYGTGLADHEDMAMRADDDLDRWSRERERRIDASISVRYVSSELVGYEDLDANGTWRADAAYGYVWVPSRVAIGWSPYHDGHWAWINPWGWTWVDAAPWGYAVSHYGRWAHIRGTWAWVPGPVRERAVYAPALVVFLGGAQFQVGAVAWFPLAPREVYRPAYQVSPAYFEHINRSNAVIAPATITNVYNTRITNTTNITNITYVNQNVQGAVVAVPMHAFAQSQPVAKAILSLPQDAALHAQPVHMAAVVPVVQSVHGGAPVASAKPPAQHERPVMARTAPPAPPVAFATQLPQLTAKPGAPIEDQRRAQLKSPVPVASTHPVKLVAPATAPIAATVPPAATPHVRPPDERRVDGPKAVAVPVEPPKAVEVKPETTRVDAAKAEADKAKTARDEAVKANVAREEAAKAAATRAQADRDRAARDEAAKANAAREEAAKAAAARAQADHDRAVRDEAAKANAAREEAAKTAAARAQADHARAARDEAERARAARDAAARAAPPRAAEPARPIAVPAPAAPAPAEAAAHRAAKPEHEHDGKAKDKRDKADEESKKH